jgi:glycosyltransferase involved in cell wall biosynthesis
VSKLYINLVPIVSGGGLQNAINFLLNLDLDKLNFNKTIVIIRNNAVLQKICNDNSYEYIVIDNTFFARLKYEIFFFMDKKSSMIFTLFGTKPIISWGSKTITGCAYSNLFYPKIDFWEYLSPLKKSIKRLKDFYRYQNVMSSDVIIFETELLTKKAVEEFSFSKEDSYTVKMSVSSIVKKGEKFIDFNIQKNRFNILYLGSAHPNKRQHLLPKIVKSMIEDGLNNFCFLLTMDEKNNYTKELLNSISKMHLESYIVNLGPVDNYKVANLIEQSDAIINIAKLESFSNNFVEAWQMERVLFVTDDEWAKDSCGDGAVYLDIYNHTSIALSIKNTMESKEFYSSTVKRGIEQLNSYPNPREKILQFVNIINNYSKVRRE